MPDAVTSADLASLEREFVEVVRAVKRDDHMSARPELNDPSEEV